MKPNILNYILIAAVTIQGWPVAVKAELEPIAYLAEDVKTSAAATSARCRFFTGNAIRRNDPAYVGADVISGSGKAAVESLSCVQRWMSECSSGSRRNYDGTQKESGSDNSDFCMYSRFANIAAALAGKPAGFFNQPDQREIAHPFVLDENCQPVSSAQYSDDEVCGQIEVGEVVTPISLVWDESGAEPWSVVQFAFNPAQRPAWFSWRASEKRPLLVYDPLHLGKIESGAQLFGTWTFGGRQTAALGNKVLAPGPWDDGYQALGSLDRNADGVVAGEELSDLGLWFDSNTDAKSQAGEVIPLNTLGVTELYYRNAAAQGKDLVASIGFKRTVDGVTTVGRSIDWHAESAPGEWEAIQRQIQRLDTMLPRNTGEATQIPLPEESFSEIQALNGAWQWQLHSSEGPHGVLTFKVHKEGAVEGHSFVEIPARSAMEPQATHKLISVFPLSGRATYSDGRVRVEFITRNKEQQTYSNGILSPDGRSLSGQSRVTVASPGKSGGSTTTSYRWIARRIGGK